MFAPYIRVPSNFPPLTRQPHVCQGTQKTCMVYRLAANLATGMKEDTAAATAHAVIITFHFDQRNVFIVPHLLPTAFAPAAFTERMIAVRSTHWQS